MDDMSQYMQQMNAAAASQSLSDASVAAQSAKEQAKTEYDRFKQGVVEGVTGPLGVDLLEKAVEKGGLKVAQKVGLGDAFKDWQEGGKGLKGLYRAGRGAVNRATAQPVTPKPVTPKPDTSKPDDTDISDLEKQHTVADSEINRNQQIVNNDAELYDESDVRIAQSKIEAHQQFKEDNPLPEENFGESGVGKAADGSIRIGADAPKPSPSTTQPGNAPPKDDVGDDDFVLVDRFTDPGEAAKATAAASDVAKGGSTMAKLTAVSAEDDFNPAGLVITAGLAIGTLFAGIFGHHRDGLPKHPPVPPPVMNASTQFGVNQ